MVNVGIIGVGNVGGNVVRELKEQYEKFQQETGIGINIARIASRTGTKRFDCVHDKDPNAILNDKNIDIVVELIGGISPAYDIIKNALVSGKNVVTANKAVIDKYGVELEELAAKNNVYLMFEGAVAGGIPIINALKVGLSGNETSEILGIINGTTNFILTKMTKDGYTYEQALGEAQQLGYAEKDPSFDVDGIDAAQKIAILASINFSTKINSNEVSIKGIRGVTKEDIQFASELGYRIKLIAIANKINGGIDIRVSPTLVSKKHPLAHIDYDMNAIHVAGHTHVTLAGEGAGGIPTASAVVSDIKNIALRMKSQYSPLKYFGSGKIKVLGKDEVSSEFYLNFHALNKPGTLNAITTIFKDRGINILQVIQKGRGSHVPLVIQVDVTSFKTMESALELVDKNLLEVKSVYPILA